MKFYGGTPAPTKPAEASYVAVTALASSVRLLLNLLTQRGLVTDERAAALAAGPDVFAVFNGGFSHREIDEALREAEENGFSIVVLQRAPYPHAEAEAAAQPKPEPVAPAPEPDVVTVPAPEPEKPLIVKTGPAEEQPNILATVFGTHTAPTEAVGEVAPFERTNEQPTRSAEIEPAPETTGTETAG